MPDAKLTALTETTAPTLTDIMYIVIDPSGTPLHRYLELTNLQSLLSGGGYSFNGRLSLSSTLAVPSAEITAAGTLYLHPFRGNKISLYNGTDWQSYTLSAAISLTLSGLSTASRPYDIFVYNNAGTLTLDAVVWTNATTRATALATQDGIYVKDSAPTYRYAGTIYIDGSKQSSMEFQLATNTTTKGRRHVWNYYNRLDFGTRKVSTTSHTYASTTYQKWNNTDVLGAEFVIGVLENDVVILAGGNQDTNAGMDVAVNWASGGGLLVDWYNSTASAISAFTGGVAKRSSISTAGLNTINVIENSTTGTANFSTGVLEFYYSC